MNVLFKCLQHELIVAYRTRKELVNPVAFFAMTIILFPLAISPDPSVLKTIAPGIVWIAALLAILLSLDRLFLLDYLEGNLQQWILSPKSLSQLVLIKVFAFWIITILPLILLTPLLATLLQLPSWTTWILTLSLLLGTPFLCLLGAMGAALTISLKQAGILIPLLILPLYIPVLIFGTGAVIAATNGLIVSVHLAWLGALLILGILFIPYGIAYALRIGVN